MNQPQQQAAQTAAYTQEEKEQRLLDVAIRQTMEYTPMGSEERIKLNPAVVRRYLTTPTKKGEVPSDADVMQFMMLCRAAKLDPWVGDAYLVGYDGKNGPEFSLITAFQALLKRAELSVDYEGMESGVIVLSGDGNLIADRQGELTLANEKLVGAWARVHRKDRNIHTYKTINLSNYDKQWNLWSSNKEGMIVKCVKAAALREAFPTTVGGLYIGDEMQQLSGQVEREQATPTQKPTGLGDLGHKTPTQTIEPPAPATAEPQAPAEPEAAPEPQETATEPQAEDAPFDADVPEAEAVQAVNAMIQDALGRIRRARTFDGVKKIVDAFRPDIEMGGGNFESVEMHANLRIKALKEREDARARAGAGRNVATGEQQPEAPNQPSNAPSEEAAPAQPGKPNGNPGDLF